MSARFASIVGLVVLLGCARPSGEPLPLGARAGDCGACHEDHFDEWAGSPHAASARSPVLEAMLPEVEAVWGARARDACVSCHAPAHAPGDEGIGCVSCHAAAGNHAERDGALVVDLARPIAGPFGDTGPTLAHATRRGAFLASPSLCGTCHELTGPNLVREPTLTEYRASPAAAEGITCADCHLPDAGERPLASDATTPRRVRSHRFVGFDPPWGAAPEEAAAAAERTRALLAEALSLEVERDAGGVRVTLANVGAGHSVPTGAAFLRDLWVDVEVDGVVVAARVLVLGDVPMRGDTPVPLLTRADRVEVGSLPAGASRAARVAIEGPLEVVLRGRAVRDDVLAALGLEARAAEVPTHEIHRVRRAD
ncbi:MAG: hypothetical protein KF729_29490 [Sandaracinaceae bacterium]|nr:hypothetical protein [Sandaracinaceae bacterium]